MPIKCFFFCVLGVVLNLFADDGAASHMNKFFFREMWNNNMTSNIYISLGNCERDDNPTRRTTPHIHIAKWSFACKDSLKMRRLLLLLHAPQQHALIVVNSKSILWCVLENCTPSVLYTIFMTYILCMVRAFSNIK